MIRLNDKTAAMAASDFRDVHEQESFGFTLVNTPYGIVAIPDDGRAIPLLAVAEESGDQPSGFMLVWVDLEDNEMVRECTDVGSWAVWRAAARSEHTCRVRINEHGAVTYNF